jgi:DNA polymerase (family X)
VSAPDGSHSIQSTDRVRPVTLGRATDLLESLSASIRDGCPLLADLTIAGDARRFEPLVFGLVIVATATDTVAALDQLCALDGIEVHRRTATLATVHWRHAEIDVRVTSQEERGSVLFATTGTSRHVTAVRERIGREIRASREDEIYRAAGLPFIVPELRNGNGEVAAAAAGRLPVLVDGADIRGDLHMHSTFSDGQDTLDAMVAACGRIGYEYIAITDHSESAAASRTISRDQLARQRDDINRLRSRHPRLAILHGVEVDILPDGRLDFDDAVLESLDIVLASLHDSAGHDPEALTQRCLGAIRHPLVNVITHPANQLVGRRGGYALDFDRIYAAAAETGTALEIDGAPSHLDLDGAHAREAIAAGVTVTIDSDCHRAASLERQMRFGVGTARRGWVRKEDVLNARPLAEVRAFINAKRAITR